MTGVIGVAMIGCAHRPHAWSYARALTGSSNAHLVGVYDPDPELGASVAGDFGAPYVDDLDTLLTTPGVRAVVVCSPTSQHREHTLAAVSRGLHVLCEKPIATTLEDATAMVDAAREADSQLHIAFVTRFLPHVQRIKAAIGNGEIGTVLGVVAGNRGRPPLPPHYPPWITNPAESGGGALIDHSVHLVDALRHLTGREVARVTAETGELFWSAGVEDSALLSLVFIGDTVASLDPSWSVPVGNPWDYDFFLRIVGTAGSVDIDDLSESVRLVSSRAGGGLRLVGFGDDPDAAMIEGFLASIAAGQVVAPCATGDDGLRSLEVALAGYESARSKTTVRLT